MHHPAFSFVAPAPRQDAEAAGGRLAGWSIPVKDSTDVASFPTTEGNPARSHIATRDDAVVTALLRAGAQIPGKTLTSELGATCYAERPGVPIIESPAFPGCTPGGSSAGAGVAVGLGLARAAHGTDAGGSIRVPAAACGVVGFKPASETLAAHGFLTRSVADQVRVLGWDLPPRRRLRIGVLVDGLFTPTDLSESRGAAVERAATLLAKHHAVVPLAPYPESAETFAHFTTLITHSFAQVDPLDNAYIAWLNARGRAIGDRQMAAAVDHRRQLRGLLLTRWDVDAVLCPTIAFDPPKLGYFPALDPAESFYQQTVWSPWCSVFNMAGTAAIALSGIHMGAVGATGPELLVLAAELERALAADGAA